MTMEKKIKIGLICLLGISIVLVSGCIGPSDDDIILKAQQTKDISMCEKISNIEKKEECICGVAMETHNSDLCDGLTAKINVADTLIGTLSHLESEDMKFRDLCFSSIAKEKLDYTLCEKMDDGWMKDYCFSDVAKLTQNNELCNKITGEFEKEECSRIVSELESGYCENLTVGSERDLCIWRRATLSNNLSDCKNINKIEGMFDSRDSCYRSIAVRTNDPKTCEHITNKKVRERCLSSVSE